MNKLPNHTALKEWSSMVEALDRGEQVVLLRKGGIADPKFGVEADRFYLYPTQYHEPGAAAEPQSVVITNWCEVVRTWRVAELALLDRMAPLVAMPRESVETRYRFRPDQALHVIAVRTWRLSSPHTIPVASAYAGCRSWVSLDDEIDIDESTAVLAEDELQRRVRTIDEMLAVRPVITS